MKKHSTWLRLAGWECRKNFANPMMLVFLAVLLLMNGWKLLDTHRRADRYAPYQDPYGMFYNGYLGTVTEEKLQHLKSIYDPLHQKWLQNTISREESPHAYTGSELTDYELLRDRFYLPIHYCIGYEAYAQGITQQAEALSQLFQTRGNAFDSHKNQRLSDAFQGRALPKFYETYRWETLLSYDYSSLAILLLGVFALAGNFVSERETEMDMVLHTTKKGTAATVAAKLLTSAAFLLGICTAFYAEDFALTFFLSDKNQALSQPVYLLESCGDSAFSITLGQFLLLFYAMKTLGILLCGCVILLISTLCRQTLPAFLLSFGTLIGLTVLRDFSGCTYLLRVFNPMELVLCNRLVTGCTLIPLGGKALFIHEAVLAGCTVLFIFLLLTILYGNRGRPGRRKSC